MAAKMHSSQKMWPHLVEVSFRAASEMIVLKSSKQIEHFKVFAFECVAVGIITGKSAVF